MSLFKNPFSKQESKINSYEDFWNWFQENQQSFYQVVKSGKNPEKAFFTPLSQKLNELKEGIFYLSGMFDEQSAELIFTPDGNVKNIVFAEEIVQAAPELKNWKFTALKPPLALGDVGIEMEGYQFNSSNLFFYAVEQKKYPDEVDITLVHDNFNEKNQNIIIGGSFIFLDNFLGELNAVTKIDHASVISSEQAEQELIPISKLKDYIIWREKEFVEKYSGTRYDTENDEHVSFEATLNNGLPLIGIINTSLLNWDRKPSHPWILKIQIEFNGRKNNGMPDDQTYQLLNEMEDEIMHKLKDADGFLNIGRETGDNLREVYFACKDFRKPSKVVHEISKKHAGQFKVGYEIFKDKYWRSFERYQNF